jgi:UDP-N-acetylmuramoyl-tripeptide--D-alanyl-D-alanine ligase
MKQLLLDLLIRILRRCAQNYLQKTKPFLIGVTGSVGKTSCRLIVAESLKKLLPQESIYTSPKNYNSDIGLSLSILGIESYRPSIDGAITVSVEALKKSLFPGAGNPSLLVLEYGIDKPGDMDELLQIAVPDIAIFTSIDLVHAANFPDGKTGIYNEKIKLLKAAKDTVFLSTEFKNGEFASDIATVMQGKTTVEYGEKQGEGQISFSDYKISVSWSKITSSFLYTINKETLLVTSNIVGEYNIAYMCVGITIADIIAHRKAYPSLWTLQTLQLNIALQPGRYSLFGTMRDDIIVDSTYNAAPGSMRKVIQETLSLQKEFFQTTK